MIFEDWGLIDYEVALKKQMEYVELVAQDKDHPGFLIFCSHPEVVTTGRQTQAGDIFSWSGPRIEVSRGGRATYHGPSQVVVYPIISLRNPRSGRAAQEVRGYIRALENCVVSTLHEYQILSHGKTQDNTTNSLEDTGVWVGKHKIASLGIAVRKWITFHGVAINVAHDETAFQGLHPCGYNSSVMTNLEKLLNEPVDLMAFKSQLKKYCLKNL
ncbi:MAG: lipoyl(octanoyl) transferase [Bdellovibrionales bacterium RIFCSPHIGHO2_01_FULL_40_29]|nr:MAG: lipoyl(octanoyl) transferase [Bdellovibrionales bacterium RIFCSPHIGHO2_01_FULL_40_29]OFZ35499.1 MAG: lipoyl(octanoyl) transferase [Bdellovibrionales bacterium RIFCSPHIGHO2_02_FULL_40_15]